MEKISNKLPENNLPTIMVWNIFRNATTKADKGRATITLRVEDYIPKAN